MPFLMRHRGLVVLLFYSSLLFVACAFLRDNLLLSFDEKIYSVDYSYSDRGVSVFMGLSDVFSPGILILLSFVLAGALIFFKKNRWAIFFLVTMGFGMFSVILLKEFFEVSRPTSLLITESGWSFPSGHTTAIAIFFFSILFAIEETVRDYRLVFLWGVFSFLFVFAMGLSRVYLGVHWFSDVVAGFALGAFWVSLIALIYEKIYESKTVNT